MAKSDQETIITLNASEKTANVWSNDPTMMRKLEDLGGENNGYSVELDVPKGWIKIQQK